MSKTYRFINATGASNVFANVTAPDQLISVSSSRSQVTRSGVTAPLIRTSFVMTQPVSLSEPGCTDGCAPHGIFTELVRIETSHAGSVGDLLKHLKEAVAVIEANPSYFDGFNFPQGADIVVPDLV